MDVEPSRVEYFFVACGCWGESAGSCVNRQRRRTSEDVSVFEGEFRTGFPTLGTFYPTRSNLKIQFRLNCLFLSLLRETFLSRVLYLVIWHLEFTDQISLPFLLYPSHLFTFSLRPPLPCSPFLSPTPTRPACYFFVQGPVIKFDISTGIKYAVGEGEKGALLQSQGQL